jgi:class 3 adenylate cyclase
MRPSGHCADCSLIVNSNPPDEAGTLAALTAIREETENQINQHHGRIANTAGDSVLAEFASAEPWTPRRPRSRCRRNSLAGTAGSRVGAGRCGLRSAQEGSHLLMSPDLVNGQRRQCPVRWPFIIRQSRVIREKMAWRDVLPNSLARQRVVARRLA